jgi:hypothetical protein
MNPHTLSKSSLQALMLAALALLSQGAAHAEANPWYIGGSQTFARESNLLRLSNGQEPPPGYSKSDTVSSTALLAGLDQAFGRQRGYGTLAVRANRFSENDIYDNLSYNLNAGLDWSTIERVSGTLAAGASQNLSSFNLQEIGLLTEKNTEDTQTLDASVRVGLVTEYALEARYGYRRVENSLEEPSVQSRNFRQNTASLGLLWRPSSATTVGVALRGEKGIYPEFFVFNGIALADRFTSQDLDFTFNHKASGASRIDVRLSYGTTEYDLATTRDFRGLTGAVTWDWQASGKSRLKLRLSHDTGQDSYAYSSSNTGGTADYSQVNTTLRVQGDHDLTSKVGLTAALSYANRDLVRTLPNLSGPIKSHGTEYDTIFSLGARWAPTRSVLLGCDASTERRRGEGDLVSDLDADRFSCYAQFTLQ